MTFADSMALLQAIGSISAVAAGFILLFLQRRAESTGRRQALFAFLGMASGYGRATLKLTEHSESKTCEKLLSEMHTARKLFGTLERLLDRLDYSPLSGEETWRAITAFMSSLDGLLHTIDAQIEFCSKVDARIAVPPDVTADLRNVSSKYLETVDYLRSLIQAR